MSALGFDERAGGGLVTPFAARLAGAFGAGALSGVDCSTFAGDPIFSPFHGMGSTPRMIKSLISAQPFRNGSVRLTFGPARRWSRIA